jgi:DNA-binding transcriptional LysR family regulator
VEQRHRQPAIGELTVRLAFGVEMRDVVASLEHGHARLPRWLVAPYLRSGQLVLLADTEGSMAIEIHALWPHTRYMPSKTRAAVDALAAEVPAMLNVEWGQN